MIAPEKSIPAALGVLLLILISACFLAYRSISSLVGSAQSVRSAQEVQTALWELLTSIDTAEISQGRFVMTGDPRLLAAFEAAVPQIEKVAAPLRQRLVSDPSQVAILDELRSLMHRRIEVARELIALRRERGIDAAVTRIASGETSRLQAQIRQAADRMIAAQERVIQQQEAGTLATARKTGAALVSAALLAVAAVVVSLLVVGRSLTARRDAERKWLESHEQRMERALKAARLGTWDWDLTNNKIVWSGAHEELWGMKPGAFKGNYQQFEAQLHPDDRESLRSSVQTALETRSEYNCEYRIVWPDGSIHWMAGRGQAIYQSDKPVRMTGVVADVTERHAAEEARAAAQLQIKVSEQRLRGVLDSMFAFVGLMSLDGVLIEVNRAPLEAAQVKKDDVLGKRVVDTTWINHSAKTQAQLISAVERAGKGETVREEVDVRVADGSTIILDTIFNPLYDGDGKIIQVVASGVDVTARNQAEAMRQKLEAQLWQAQKMEALGTLAGGVAHDFNNILSAIAGNAELARQDVGAGHAALVSINEIRKASQRAKFLVQQILAFSRKQASERVSISLKTVVEECTTMLRAILPATVELNVQCQDGTPNVLADANQIHQVILNLGTNAWHSLAGETGRIDIVLEPATVESDLAEQYPNLHAGRYACLRVADTGAGMSEETLNRIFEPFFTTKPVGEGTGLGLSVVDGIVKSHEGAIRVTSLPGVGSTFTLYFPAVEEAIAPAAIAHTHSAQGQGQHILYLDDDEALVSLTIKVLKRNGYDAVGFTVPAAALEELRKNPARYDLLVTDHSMPGTSGIQVVKQVKQLRPDLPIILASGYVTDDLKQRARDVGVRHVIYKPQTVNEFCEVVQRTLEETRKG